MGHHAESLEIQYDPSRTSYSEMLKMFWANHDPTTHPNSKFAEAPNQYMSAIFYHNEEQKQLAERTREEEARKRQVKILTEIVEAEAFYNAEDYHQKYLLRKQKVVLQDLNLSDEELIRSHAACRLNGYCGGYGKLDELEKELPQFNLSLNAQQRVKILTLRGPCEVAIFALSRFWFPEARFGCAPGVLRTRVGYTGGKKENPTYESMGDHAESLEIQYDPSKTSYSEMLKMFWANHDPTKCPDPKFPESPNQYMSAIFYDNEEQKQLAEQTMKEEARKHQGKKILTQIAEAEFFYNAEDYHQKYLLRQQQDVLQDLNLSDEKLIRSHAACRLNGYCGGYGKLDELEKELPQFNLSMDAQQRVRMLTQRGAQM